MKYNIVSYLIGEGFKNVLKNKKSTGASLVIMCLTMFVFGACIILSENVNHIMNQLEIQQPMQVFIEKKATQSQIDELGEKIKKIDAVSSIEFVSSEVDTYKLITTEKGNGFVENVTMNIDTDLAEVELRYEPS